MPREFRVLSQSGDKQKPRTAATPEEKLVHFRNVTGSLLYDAVNAWGDIWSELQEVSESQENFKPACGWPEFLEKVWLLGHYLDYAKRFCEGKE